YSVVLLDEIEKAHPEIFNMLLQILEDGRLTDAKGRTASFKNSILIMTSNVGSEQIAQMGELGFSASEEEKEETVKDKVMDSLKEEFRPEFLNRIDDIIIFNHLTKKQIKEIVELELKKVKKRLNKKGISIELTEEVKKILAKEGFDKELGARPLKRTIQKMVLNPLAMKIVIGDVENGDNVKVKSKKGEITFKKTKKKKKAKKKVPSSV
ncbi:MAG: AAA family ATPase, partial [Minisyncoccales bacterium]